jgi:hypothetical protein
MKSIQFNVDLDWLLTIAYYRGKIDKYKNSPIIVKLIQKINNIDYIVAPIADNRMFTIIDSFINGEMTDEQCLHCLAATNLGYQYVFVSENALKNLFLKERFYLCEKEREDLNAIKKSDVLLGEERIKKAMIDYRGKGRYIDEILK